MIHAEAGRRGARVMACSSFAAEQGVVPGLPLAEAKTLLDPACRQVPAHYVPHDPAADAAALHELAIGLQRFSPRVGIEGEDALVLDIGGCAHLFGGEPQMARQVWQALYRAGYRSRVAIADTPGAAWGVARFTRERVTVVPTERAAEALDALPIEALRIPEAAAEQLHRLDIRTIGRLRALPRDSLLPRFGSELVAQLDRLFGRIPEPLSPVRSVEPCAVRRDFEYPLRDRQEVEAALSEMLADLFRRGFSAQSPSTFDREDRSRTLHRGILDLHCLLQPEQGAAAEFSVGASRPLAAIDPLWELLALRLERTPLPEEVARIELCVRSAGLVEVRQRELYETAAEYERDRDFARLLDRLSNRLGAEAVVRPRLVPDAQPELACRFAAVQDSSPARPCDARPFRETDRPNIPPGRPLVLWDDPPPIEVVSLLAGGPPAVVRWNGRAARVVRQWGPERIATGWWRGPEIERDYYRIETEEGRQFWIYRDRRARRWRLHGSFE